MAISHRQVIDLKWRKKRCHDNDICLECYRIFIRSLLSVTDNLVKGQMVDPSTDSLLLLYDDAQAIYRKSRGLDFSLSSVGIKATGRTSILRLNYRNTREILQFACEFASKSMDEKAADDDHIPMIQPETGGASGPGPAFRQFANIGDEIAYSVRCIKAWHERGDFLGDIAVICMKPDHGKRIAHQLQSRMDARATSL